MKRIKLSDRKLPNYTKGEEITNMVTHIVGGVLGILALVLCLYRSIQYHDAYAIISSAIYAASMITLYTVSSVYHGLRANTGKKVMQIIDHCTIYFLIAGTYTPIVLVAFRPELPVLGWGLLAFQWVATAIAVTLTAIDLKKYNVFSMICYIGMGWAILPFWNLALQILGSAAFIYLLSGGIAYTIGAVLYGIGSRKPWMHSVFHVFVVIGSLLQFICIWRYFL